MSGEAASLIISILRNRVELYVSLHGLVLTDIFSGPRKAIHPLSVSVCVYTKLYSDY